MKYPIFVTLMAVLLISCVSQTQNSQPLVDKSKELFQNYQKKKSEGYDMPEVEKTVEQIWQAKEQEDRAKFIGLLHKLEEQLKKLESNSDKIATKGARSSPSQLPELGEVSESFGQQKSAWPMYGQNINNTFRSSYTGLTDRPTKPTWTFNTPGGQGVSSPVAVSQDGTVYVGTWKNDRFAEDKMEGHSGLLIALSKDGNMKWFHDSNRGSFLASGVESSPLILDDGTIIYGKDDGYVYALKNNGELIWEFALDDPFDPSDPFADNEQVIPSPVLGPNKTIYICSHWGNVYNPRSVERIMDLIPEGRRDEVDIEGVVKDKWGKLYAIDTNNGSKKWVYDPSEDPPVKFGKKNIWGSPASDPTGTVYFTAFDKKNGYLYAINPDGTQKWRSVVPESLTSSVAIGKDGTIYVGSFKFAEKASVYAFSNDGNLKWNYKIDENRITSGPSIGHDGTVYVGGINWGFMINPDMSKKAHLYAIKGTQNKPELKWKFEVEYGINASPVIDRENNIFFATYSDPLIVGDLGPYHIYALNKEGVKLWSYPLGGRVQPSTVIGEDGTIYVGTTHTEATLYAFKP